jgi:hypothetical protein
MTKPISTLRRHMIEDMKMRNMSPNSQKVSAYAVANFAAFHGKSRDKPGPEHEREYRLYLIGRGLKATSINPIIGALRFFYGTTRTSASTTARSRRRKCCSSTTSATNPRARPPGSRRHRPRRPTGARRCVSGGP